MYAYAPSPMSTQNDIAMKDVLNEIASPSDPAAELTNSSTIEADASSVQTGDTAQDTQGTGPALTQPPPATMEDMFRAFVQQQQQRDAAQQQRDAALLQRLEALEGLQTASPAEAGTTQAPASVGEAGSLPGPAAPSCPATATAPAAAPAVVTTSTTLGKAHLPKLTKFSGKREDYES